MVTLERWYADPIIAAALHAPDTEYMERLTAHNDALFARLHAEDEELVEIDYEALDAYLATADRQAIWENDLGDAA